MPFGVLGELRAGFAGGVRSGENEANLVRFLVVQHHLYLFARDAHFDHLPQIPRP